MVRCWQVIQTDRIRAFIRSLALVRNYGQKHWIILELARQALAKEA